MKLLALELCCSSEQPGVTNLFKTLFDLDRSYARLGPLLSLLPAVELHRPGSAALQIAEHLLRFNANKAVLRPLALALEKDLCIDVVDDIRSVDVVQLFRQQVMSRNFMTCFTSNATCT